MKCVKDFLQKNWDRQRFLLLGYSGGPDSKALLYSLLDAGCDKIHVAHVDHGWRQESAEEALEIAAHIRLLGLKFSTCRLEFSDSKNAEEAARNGRLDFFTTLFKEGDIQALVLGHQADDLAETALKRVLEGAHLSFLGGMQKISYFNQMPVWRPLLSIRKQVLIDFLEDRHQSYIQDVTNFNPVYLRSRMRVETLPLLEASFGKNFISNLCLLSERSNELRQYFENKIQKAKIVKLAFGVLVYCSPFDRVEARFLLQKIARSLSITLTASVLEEILDRIADVHSFKKIILNNFIITNVKGWVCFLQIQNLGKKEKFEILQSII